MLLFLFHKFTHDWQVTSVCCKSSPYEQAKEFHDNQFYYFPFKPKKNKQNKTYAFLNHSWFQYNLEQFNSMTFMQTG